MTNTASRTVVALSTFLIFSANVAYADHEHRGNGGADIWLGIATAVLASEVLDNTAQQRHSRRDRSYDGYDNRDYDRARNHQGRNGRHDFAASYTSEPIRGGSSRRTRVIENPYPNRPLTGITFTGIDRDVVHINDVISYPRKQLLSRRGYSLSLYHPSRFLSARGYVDYISVKAKRKEYFTVTFHYQ